MSIGYLKRSYGYRAYGGSAANDWRKLAAGNESYQLSGWPGSAKKYLRNVAESRRLTIY